MENNTTSTTSSSTEASKTLDQAACETTEKKNGASSITSGTSPSPTTKPKNSGEKESLSVSEELSRIEAQLAEYETRIGLVPFQNNSDVQRIMLLSENELKAMSSEDCGMAAFVLAQESYHVQKEINKQKGRAAWCASKINEIAARTIDQVNQYVPYEVKRLMVIKNNDYARKVYSLEQRAKLCIERLTDIPKMIRDMSMRLAELQQSKRGTKWQQ